MNISTSFSDKFILTTTGGGSTESVVIAESAEQRGQCGHPPRSFASFVDVVSFLAFIRLHPKEDCQSFLSLVSSSAETVHSLGPT